MSTKISSSNIQASALVIFSKPKVTSIAYPGTDTAVDPAGAQPVTLTGSGFVSGLVVYIGGSIVGVSSVVSSTQVTFVTPVKVAGNYTLTVVNADGGTAVFVPGIQYSGVPAWTTSAGSLGTIYETAAINSSLTAISDSAVSYTVTAGTIPATTTLNTITGVLSGTAPTAASPTTYNFTVTAKDAEDQDTARNFSYIINPDAVTWSTPAAGATLSGALGTAYTQALSAISAAGRAITYTANALPAGLSISGASITGTPSTTYSSSTLLTATAATTGKTATRTVAWAVVDLSPTPTVEYLVIAGGGPGGGWAGGGGGAGGFRTATGFAVAASSPITITIGAGGVGPSAGTEPVYSSGNSSAFSTITSVGGGKGGGFQPSYTAGAAGGSGGGGCYLAGGGAGTAGPPIQGYAGGPASSTADYGGGGGGGASAVGNNGQTFGGGGGGAGRSSSITGTVVTYAGGGGGGLGNAGSGGLGGGGGGGSGGNNSRGIDGTPNTGGGGGAAGSTNTFGSSHKGGGSGGSGVVIIRYADTYRAATATTGSPTITVSGGFRVYNFTGSGTITF